MSPNRTTLIAFAGALALAPAALAAEATYPLGSRVGLVPPPGFVAEEKVHGFVNRENNGLIIIIEMPKSAYAEIGRTMTPAALKKQGVIQEKRESLALGGGKAILIAGRQAAEGTQFRKWILVAQLPDLTALVTTQIPLPAAGAYSEAAIHAALASLAARARVPIDEFVALMPFRFGDLAGMRPLRVAGPAAILLTDGPRDDADAVDQPLLLVAAVPGGPAQSEQRETFARNYFGNIAGYTDVRVTGSEMLRLGGSHVHEVRADARHVATGRDVKIVQWIRFGTTAFVHLVGIAPAQDWTQAFLRFRGVRDGLAPR
ncbi:MAG: hypothetical protein HY056_01380 [Proteobacteria bacterium]|nr:hypothetical protein [Pseudomonadota bacterium]